ncbi:thymidylate synthase [Streptomyces sp. 4N509B]|uniref:thymidylate synthase n=1 Tax=Streptomyces sp. 4N509B TaxID=3457413 RepID=UPI003FD0E5B6
MTTSVSTTDSGVEPVPEPAPVVVPTMSPPAFATFEDAYLAQLRETFDRPEYRNAPRGAKSSERLGIAFRVRDPVQRHVSLRSRRTNLVFNFAEALWYLSGSDRLDQIGYYAPSIARYSADGQRLAGTAYGPRIFNHLGSGLDQWSSVLETLAGDTDSKRAVIQIFDPHELRVPGNIDVACTLALQFMIRDDGLCGVGFMRANDAFRGIVSDVFSFTLLLELMARQLDVPVAAYHHHVGSLHVYDTDRAWAGEVIAEAGARTEPPSRFPAMPAGDNWPHVHEVLAWERRLRENSARLSAADLAALDLPPYWRHVVGLFEVYRQIKHRTDRDARVVDALPDTFRTALVSRWPALAG